MVLPFPCCGKRWINKGNSNTGERTALLALFRVSFPELRIETLYADREFIGNKWLPYLRKAGLPTASAARKGEGGAKRTLQRDFWNLKTGEDKTLEPVMIYGQQHYLEATRLNC